jgi:hydroxymethylpyrimidine pyrophosphatase-like HAD family hydrolase
MARELQVILCTGRAVAAAEPYRQAIGAQGPMVYYNGAEIVDMPSGRVLRIELLDPETVDFCVDLARHRGVHFQIFLPVIPGRTEETLMIEKAGPEADLYCRHTGITPVLGDLKKILAGEGAAGCLKGMFIAGTAIQDEIRSILIRRFGGRISAVRTRAPFLEIMAPGVSKGAGLLTALRDRGLEAAAVMALGDGENDLPLFEAAGFSAAPANAVEAIRAAADVVFGSNADDGAAAYLETLFSLDR